MKARISQRLLLLLPFFSHRNEIRLSHNIRPEFNVPSDSQFSGEIGDLEDIDGITRTRHASMKPSSRRGVSLSRSSLP
jgi:hypothetical protein